VIVGPLVKRFLCAILGDSKAQYLMNEWLMIFWIINFIAVHIVFFLALAVWSKVAILYLADISVYACIGQHYTGMAASLAGRKADEDRAPSGDEEDVCC
jgi:hypothetical protein